jgi:hypothetical protein
MIDTFFDPPSSRPYSLLLATCVFVSVNILVSIMEDQSDIENFFVRFPAISKEILKRLDDQSLAKFKEVSKQLFPIIDMHKPFWIRSLKNYNENFEIFLDSWKKVINKTPTEIIKDLAISMNQFHKQHRDQFYNYDSFGPERIWSQDKWSLTFGPTGQMVPMQWSPTFGPTGKTVPIRLTPILIAADRGELELCKHVFGRIGQLNDELFDRKTALRMADQTNHLEVFNFIYHNPDVETKYIWMYVNLSLKTLRTKKPWYDSTSCRFTEKSLRYLQRYQPECERIRPKL